MILVILCEPKAEIWAMKPGEKFTHAHYCNKAIDSGMNTSDVLSGIFMAILAASRPVY